MKVKLIQMTDNPIDVMWVAARTCYSAKSPIEMWSNDRFPNLDENDTQRENRLWKLVKQVLDSGHSSIAEHCYFTFCIEGVSRALLAQITRHRAGIVFSVMSQRYVEIKESGKELEEAFNDTDYSSNNYKESKIGRILEKYFTENEFKNVNGYFYALDNYLYAINRGDKPEDARRFLPNATKTNITMSINFRELMHISNLRLCCFDDKTEILTTNGWKFFKDLSGDEIFYSLNPITMNGEYTKSLKIFDYEYEGEMVDVNSQSISLCTTPNHKMFCSYSYDNKKFILDECSNHNKHKRILMKKNCKEIEGELPSVYNLNGFLREDANQYTQWRELMPDRKVPIKEFLQFLGFYICDGCCIKGGKHYNICVSKGDKQKLEKYQKFLEKISPNKTKLFFDAYCWKLVVHDRYLYEYLSKLGKAPEKHIPNELFKLDSSLLHYLFDGFLDGDANKSRNVFYTVSKQLADDFQRLCLHVGYSATINVYDRRDKEHIIKGRNSTTRLIKSNYPCYYISINRTKNEPIIKTTNRNAFTVNNYKGRVYCVELEKNNIVYVRRNGRCVWSGNSRAQKEIRELLKLIKEEVNKKDERLASLLVPICEVNGFCSEHACCGRKPRKAEVIEGYQRYKDLER